MGKRSQPVPSSEDRTRSTQFDTALKELHTETEGPFRSVPVGLVFFDQELRFLGANDVMAVMMDRTVEDLVGRTVHEAVPEFAAFIEKHYRPILKSGQPVLNALLQGPTPGYPDDQRLFRVNRVPVSTPGGAVIGVVATIQDLTDLIQERTATGLKLDFERLVGDISARFAGLPAQDVDRVVMEALGRLGEFFDLDRAQLGEIVEPDQLRVTHSWVRPGMEAVPVGTMYGAVIPGAMKRLLAGEIFSFSNIEELTDEQFAVDKEGFLELGTTAHLSVPVEIGGEVVGVVTFGSLSGPRDWPEELVERLRLIAEVFGSALARRDSDRQLQSALSEVETLKNRLLAESRHLEKEIKASGPYEDIVGRSPLIQHLSHQVEQVAPTEATILITGETGTGKELVARTLHRLGTRRDHPLIKVNCASLPGTLIDSELFGHERGAFTGAVKSRAGRFEVADGGTIFLDEVGDLPLELQAKLLRVLQDGEFERLGSSATRTVNVRVIAATNRNLTEAIEQGSFRADLYYRLRVIPIELPPLREYPEDIPLLSWHFIRRNQIAMNKTIRRIPTRVTTALMAYDWPGNVRELANVIERAVILTPGETLMVDEAFTRLSAPTAAEPTAIAENLEAVERAHIIDILERCAWKVKGPGNAAERLGLNPSTLRARMKKLGIQRP